MDDIRLYRPKFREEVRLLTSEDSGFEYYYAFPSLADADDNIALACVKRGQKHWGDDESALICVKIDKRARRAIEHSVIFSQPGVTPQMGEIMRTPKGDIRVYIDAQRAGTNQRVGMTALVSADGGARFELSGRVGVIDGVEYGYPMQMCARGGVMYMAVMTFPNLTGSNKRAVHMISSRDDGVSWRFECDLTQMAGTPFNECSLIATDDGFLLFTRGEAAIRDKSNPRGDFDSEQWLIEFDSEYNVTRRRDFHATYPGFSLTGRPRIIARGGEILLFTRQWTETKDGRDMTMDLYRINARTFEVNARIRLDDARFKGQDGHYPIAFIHGGILSVLTYISCPPDGARAPKCDLVLLGYELDEILSFGGGEA